MKLRMEIFLVMALVLSPSIAYAYIDPGSGAMALQVLLAALAAGVIALRTYWKRIIGYFNKKDKDD